MEHKFKGFYLDKEGKQQVNPEEISAKVKDLKDPEITFKLNELEHLDLKTLITSKVDEANEGITFYAKFE